MGDGSVMTYALIDTGDGEKLERFGEYTLIRPCAQAIWPRREKEGIWKSAHARFTREEGKGWIHKDRLPKMWVISIEGIKFRLMPTDFGHLGVFPEHVSQWHFLEKQIGKVRGDVEALNLFAYTGGATMMAAKAGAKVCHLDASKTSVAWAKENAELSGFEKKPIRYIIDDALKFLQRESRRGQFYRGIILDPPSFGRGKQGEVFKIERDLLAILEASRKLLKDPLFVLFTSHTPGFTPLVMHHLLQDMMQGYDGEIESGELVIDCLKGKSLPSGFFARWSLR